MITPEFLQSCADEQINKGVAWLEVNKEFNLSDMCKFQYFACNAYLTDFRDYCTNPNDAMPVAFANFISLRFSRDNGWIARKGMHVCFNKNPLRAICEVYLLMSNDK